MGVGTNKRMTAGIVAELEEVCALKRPADPARIAEIARLMTPEHPNSGAEHGLWLAVGRAERQRTPLAAASILLEAARVAAPA